MTTPAPALRYLPGALAMAFVGSSVGVSRALVDAPLCTAQALRYAVAALLLVVLARRRGAAILRPRGAEWIWLAAVAATGLVLFNVAVVRGVAHAEPAAIAVAVACVPVLLGVIGPLMTGCRPTVRIVAAAVVVTVGSAVVEGVGRADGTGVFWAAVAMACEAGFTLLAVPALPRLGAWGVSLHSVWMGAVAFAVLGVTVEGPRAVARLDARMLLAGAYLAVLVTAAAFVLWYSTVRTVGADRAGLLAGVAPAAAALVGAVTGAGLPGPPVWAGIAIVVCGLACGLAGGRQRRGSAANGAGPTRPAQRRDVRTVS